MPDDELKSVVKHAVKEALIMLGFDVNDPRENQKNQLFLDKTRKRCERVHSRAQDVAIGCVITGLFGAAVWALNVYIGGV